MFDISFAKLFVVGIIALIILGPEKLPAVARFAGVMVGRLRRFTSNIKAEMNEQLNDSGLNEIRQTFEDATQNVRTDLQNTLSEVQDSLEEAKQAYLEEREKVQTLQEELVSLKSQTQHILEEVDTSNSSKEEAGTSEIEKHVEDHDASPRT